MITPVANMSKTLAAPSEYESLPPWGQLTKTSKIFSPTTAGTAKKPPKYFPLPPCGQLKNPPTYFPLPPCGQLKNLQNIFPYHHGDS